MPSESQSTRARDRGTAGRIVTALHSQGLGLLCAGASILLLAAGSVVIAATREGASANVRLDDIRVFFLDPSAWHLWFYLLLPVMALYGLNTLLCTWRALALLIRSGARSPALYGPSVMHLGFLLALWAHAVGGMGGGEDAPVTLGSAWTALDEARQGRLLALEVERLPGGQVKQVHAHVELREPSGETERQVVGYNAPASALFGSRLWLLVRQGFVPTVELSHGRRRCSAPARGICSLGNVSYYVLGILPGGHGSTGAAASLLAQDPERGNRRLLIRLNRSLDVGNGTLTLTRLGSEPQIMLRSRRAPGNPWALAAVLVFIAGMVMMGRRWLRPGSSA